MLTFLIFYMYRYLKLCKPYKDEQVLDIYKYLQLIFKIVLILMVMLL